VTAAPLEASDPERAAALKRKVLERLTDVTRHYRALEAAMAAFGEGFERDRFRHAAASEDPTELNQVKAVERGLDQLFNYIAELTALGLELAELRAPDDEPSARGDLRKLREIEVIDERLHNRLTRVAGLRNRMVHDYVGVAALDVHEAVRVLHAALPRFVGAYQGWLRAGFTTTMGRPRERHSQ
jgi:uncharacterized protein YutE (UPF0331/DUF86 family)